MLKGWKIKIEGNRIKCQLNNVTNDKQVVGLKTSLKS
jgi:hypothetical protein